MTKKYQHNSTKLPKGEMCIACKKLVSKPYHYSGTWVHDKCGMTHCSTTTDHYHTICGFRNVWSSTPRMDYVDCPRCLKEYRQNTPLWKNLIDRANAINCFDCGKKIVFWKSYHHRCWECNTVYEKTIWSKIDECFAGYDMCWGTGSLYVRYSKTKGD